MAASRFGLALALLASGAFAAATAFTWQAGLASIYDDSVSYLVMAQGLDPWSAAGAAVAAAFPRESYPPVFPLAVALVGGAHDWRIAHLLVAASFGASVFLAGWHARAVTGSSAMGLATALTLAVLPEGWLNLKGILSEFPYLALSLATLVWHRRVREDSRRGPWIGLGALLAAAVLTRTVGIALIAGVAAAEVLRGPRGRDRVRLARLGWVLAMPLACAALWYAVRPTASGDDTYVRIGSGILASVRAHGAAWLLDSALANAASLMYSWLHALEIFWSSPWQPRALLGSAVGVLALAGVAGRALRGEADALYAVFYVGILLLWPFPGHMYRLGLPIVPVMLAAAWWVLAELARAGAASRRPRYAAAASFAPLVLCLPAVLFYVAARTSGPDARAGAGAYRRSDIAEFYRIASGPLAASIADRQIGIFLDMERIRATTPASARILWKLPDYVALLAGREGVGLPPATDEAGFARELRQRRVDYIYVTALPLRDESPGDDDPLAPGRLSRAYTDVVWSRGTAGREPEAALLKVDAARLEGIAGR